MKSTYQKISSVSLLFISIGLVACGKEGEFKKAIDAKLSNSPKCLSIFTSVSPSYGINRDDF